jgi:hypothetical protein
MMACFGAVIAADVQERNHRFLEEALELVQACGATASEAHQLVDYVYGRPVGDKHQEVGGVMVTLAALCLAQGMDMHEAGEAELARIWTKVEHIRAKQAAKPKHSPLPEYFAAPQPSALPERDASKPAEQQGLFRKFDVRRADGSDTAGGKHYGCEYFVIDVDHDAHAGAALMAYAAACEATHPDLARDLRAKWCAPLQPSASPATLTLADAVAHIERKAEEYASQFGYGDAGTLCFDSQVKMDHYTSLTELADELRELAAP